MPSPIAAPGILTSQAKRRSLARAWWRAIFVMALCLAVGLGAWAQTSSTTLTIITRREQAATVGIAFKLALHATGGTAPYKWQLSSASMPSGLSFDQNKGVISGTPTQAGTFTLGVVVADSGTPAAQRETDIVLQVVAPATAGPLTIDWKQRPTIKGDAIQGSVVVANHSDQTFDLTVVILGVNQVGRATALGYQHFNLQSQGDQVIPFGASPGPGDYVIHADAVAEVAITNSIYRARKQTQGPLKIRGE